MLGVLLSSFLCVAMIAFGWYPCGCCTVAGIPTACCPSDDIPTTLYVTITDHTGFCPCVDGVVVPIYFDSVSYSWKTDPAGFVLSCGDSSTYYLELICTFTNPSFGWLLYFTYDGVGFSCAPVSSPYELIGSCNPFSLAGTGGLIGVPPNCTCSDFFTFTVTQ